MNYYNEVLKNHEIQSITNKWLQEIIDHFYKSIILRTFVFTGMNSNNHSRNSEYYL